MNNQYDELKNLLNVSRNMLGKNDLTESRKVLKRKGIINEQEVDDDGPTNIDIDSEQEIEIETTPDEDKQKSYRVSGGLITLHGNTKQELELSTDEKTSYQETMDEFVNEVSERYIELYEQITGDKFQRADVSDIQTRIENNCKAFLATI